MFYFYAKLICFIMSSTIFFFALALDYPNDIPAYFCSLWLMCVTCLIAIIHYNEETT